MASVDSPKRPGPTEGPGPTEQHGPTDFETSKRAASREAERAKLRTSRFDVVTSLFMALILFIGAMVAMLFIIWLTNRWVFPRLAIAPIIEEPAGRADNPEGFERDFEPPGAEEVEELMEPTLEDTLEAVTDAVSSVAASLVTTDTDATATTEGTGVGDNRPPGPEGEGDDIVPRFERWQLNFVAVDLNDYATQLDFYLIELGAIGGQVQGVDVASNLSGTPTNRRIVDTENEKRLYFMWLKDNPLANFDQQLLASANISLASGRSMLKFIPPDLENQLAQIELQHATENGHPSVTQIAKTIFESQSDGDGFKFEVVSQRYRTAGNP